MTREGQFGPSDAIALLTISISAKAFYTSPAVIMDIAGTAGWYMALISCITAMTAFLFTYFLLKRFKGKNLMEIYDLVLGKPVGFFLSFLLLAAFLYTAAMELREFAEVMKVYVFHASPIEYLMLLFITASCIYGFLGLETLSRFAKLAGYVLLLGLVLVFLLSLQNYDPVNLIPIFGHGLSGTLIHGVLGSSYYGEIMIAGVIINSMGGARFLKRVSYTSLALSGLVIGGSIFACTLTFPYYAGREMTAPMYQMVTLIHYGGFVQRLEAIFLFIWCLSSLISITALFYISLMVYCHMFRLQDKKPLVVPAAVIVLYIALLPDNFTQLLKGYLTVVREYGGLIYVPSILTLLIAFIRRKKGGKKCAE